VLLIVRFREIQQPQNAEKRTEKRNLSGGGSAKPDLNTVAGRRFLACFLALFLGRSMRSTAVVHRILPGLGV
jgi:hypothetical protein